MAAMQPKLVIILKARGQLIYKNRTLEKMTPPKNVRYATCVNFGVCALGQAREFIETIYVHYEQGETMDSLLPILRRQYEIHHSKNITTATTTEIDKNALLYEFKRQSEGFWTEKDMVYEKYLRCYPKKGEDYDFTPIAFTVQNGETEDVDLTRFISITERIKLSDFIQNLKTVYPYPIDVYDTGCLKVLSDEESMETTVSEPIQSSRIEFTGGCKSRNRKKRKTKRRKML